MENKIKVVDAFKMRDRNKSPIKGVVVCKDENGKIIFKKNNLVVLGGRKIILKLFENALTLGAGESVKHHTKFKLDVDFGTGTNITENTTESNSNSISNARKIDIFERIEWNIDIDDDDPHIKIPIEINGTGLTAFNMSEIALILRYSEVEGENERYDKEIMFSRLVFDPLPLTSSNSYTINYYLYF